MPKLIQLKKAKFEDCARAVSFGVLTADEFEGEENQKALQARADEVTVEREKAEAKSLTAFEKKRSEQLKQKGKQ